MERIRDRKRKRKREMAEFNIRATATANIKNCHGIHKKFIAPESPAQAWLMAMASVLEMMGQISSVTVALVVSWLRMRGDDTMHQAPK